MFVFWGPRHASLRDAWSKFALRYIIASHADDSVATSSLHVLDADQVLCMLYAPARSVCVERASPISDVAGVLPDLEIEAMLGPAE